MPTVKIREFRKDNTIAARTETFRAYQIVEYAHESSDALHDAFKKLKGGRKGAATDEEQDVLRAMLLSAGSGLDASLKQLFKDSLSQLLWSNEDVKKGFEAFVDRAIRRGRGESDIDTKFLAQALVSPLPIMKLSEKYVYDLTGSSLQSADQVFSASSALGLDPKSQLRLDEKKLKPIFEIRNKIVHEFDIDFAGARRNRVQRSATKMVEMSNLLLETSQTFVEAVYAKLPEERDN